MYGRFSSASLSQCHFPILIIVEPICVTGYGSGNLTPITDEAAWIEFGQALCCAVEGTVEGHGGNRETDTRGKQTLERHCACGCGRLRERNVQSNPGPVEIDMWVG